MKNFVFLLSLFVLSASFVPGPSVLNPSTPTFDALPPGGAYCMFAGKFGGEVTKEEIACHQQLTVEGCARGSRIFTFTLTITQNGKKRSLQTDSNELTKTMQIQLKSLSAGDIFEFSKMKAYLPNGKDEVLVQGKPFFVI